MKKFLLATSLLMTSIAVQAHDLPAVPHGLVHEILHALPIILPLALLMFVVVRRIKK